MSKPHNGWPGSVFEFMDIIPRLTGLARFGGDAKDAVTVIAPSLPGYGLSFLANQKRFGMADCFADLMTQRTSYWSRPTSRLADSNGLSMLQRVLATRIKDPFRRGGTTAAEFFLIPEPHSYRRLVREKSLQLQSEEHAGSAASWFNVWHTQ